MGHEGPIAPDESWRPLASYLEWNEGNDWKGYTHCVLRWSEPGLGVFRKQDAEFDTMGFVDELLLLAG